MEIPVTALKAFILANWNTYITAASTPEVPLTQLAAVNLVAGVVEPDQHLDDVSVFIMPENETFEELSIETTAAECSLSVLIFSRNADPELLFTKALRYSAAFLSMIAEHRTLDGSMADIAATAQDFYWGVDGNEDVKAVKIDLTAVYEM